MEIKAFLQWFLTSARRKQATANYDDDVRKESSLSSPGRNVYWLPTMEISIEVSQKLLYNSRTFS